MNTLSSLLIRLSLVVIGAMLPLLVLEAGRRIEDRIRKGIPLALNPGDKWDTYLGWTGKEHLFEPVSDKPVLVLGDSFTDGLDVPSLALALCGEPDKLLGL